MTLAARLVALGLGGRFVTKATSSERQRPHAPGRVDSWKGRNEPSSLLVVSSWSSPCGAGITGRIEQVARQIG